MNIDYLIVTAIPAFYKVNLYNELALRHSIHVIFIASETAEKRGADFSSVVDARFSYDLLSESSLQSRPKISNLLRLCRIKKKYTYRRLLVGGWDMQEYWYLSFFSPKTTNCMVLESGSNESSATGIKGFIKRFFLRNIETVFASGQTHLNLLKSLRFNGNVKITKGVGIINRQLNLSDAAISQLQGNYRKKFLFIGRLVQEKNIKTLVGVFQNLPDHELTIVGSGPEEPYLRSLAAENVHFLGGIANKHVSEFIRLHDFLILLSTIEPWGLVVEEALLQKTPVIVSSFCGVSELVDNGVNGYVVDPKCTRKIENLIRSIDNDDYQLLRTNLMNQFIDQKDTIQVSAYDF